MKNKVIIKVKKKLYNVVALPVLKKLFRFLPIISVEKVMEEIQNILQRPF